MNQIQERKNDPKNTGNQKNLENNNKEQNDLATKNSYQDKTHKPKEQKNINN